MVFSLENKEEKRVLIVVEKKKQKADYESEEYQNDVRYQNRTEINPWLRMAKRDQGFISLFGHLKETFISEQK